MCIRDSAWTLLYSLSLSLSLSTYAVIFSVLIICMCAMVIIMARFSVFQTETAHIFLLLAEKKKKKKKARKVVTRSHADMLLLTETRDCVPLGFHAANSFFIEAGELC